MMLMYVIVAFLCIWTLAAFAYVTLANSFPIVNEEFIKMEKIFCLPVLIIVRVVLEIIFWVRYGKEHIKRQIEKK